ncbi:hypothetical protein M3Y95_00950400 [Aphelenchoides besseyi]|nr:hypothetical protein M3Y95_00950400 [Aphelenchoides besseyi]
MDPQARLDLIQKIPMTDENRIQERLDIYNQRTLVFENEEKIVYLFDYNKSESGDVGRSEIINRHVLKKLKDNGHWSVLRHPLVLNYIDQILLRCTLFYTIHIIVNFVLLFLLYSYILGPTVEKNMVVTVIITFFVFFMVVKAALKLQTGWNSVSFWFKISYLFTLITYAITLLFVWSVFVFKFDDYHPELKRTIAWFLPIVAVLSSWINCLFVLRKSPCGIYVAMMSKILRSFLGTTVIWIPTLFSFAFAFQLIMRDSGTQPWDDPHISNATSIFMAMFQSFTKTSAMMIGEVEANDILERRNLLANLLLIAFEVITVILLMNLMVSLAVGDVNELRQSSEEYLLRIKVNYCIESLHLSEQVSLLDSLPFINVLHRSTTNNVIVLSKNHNQVYSHHFKAIRARFFNESNVLQKDSQEVFELIMNSTGLKVKKENLSSKSTLMALKDCTFRLIEVAPSGVCLIINPDHRSEINRLTDQENSYNKYQRWLIGLNWRGLLNY